MLDYIDDRQSLSTLGFLTLRRRWKLVFTCIALSLAAAAIFVIQRGVSYTASTQFLVYVKEVQPGSDLVISLGRADLTQVENEIEIIRSRGTLAKVVQSLNLADDPEFVPSATLPREIVRWLFSVPQATTDEGRGRQEIAVDSLAKHIAIQRIGTSHTILLNVTTSDPQKSALIANEISQIMLQSRVSAEQDGDRSPLLRERLQGLGPSVYVMTPALVPDKPSGPRKLLILLGALVTGFVAGLIAALLLDFRDKTIRTAAQVERFGLECIGALPLLARRMLAARGKAGPDEDRPGQDGLLPAPLAAQTLLRMTAAAEAVKVRVVGIASPTAGEGATTVARHFAQTAARSHRNVLLVEASRSPTRGSSPETRGDFRRGDDGGPDVLAIVGSDEGEGPANWWMHCQRKSLAAYDLIVVGLPPLEQGPAFRLAAQNIDGILLVIQWGGVDRERIERALAVSGTVPTDFIGAVLNKVDDRMIGRFGDKLWQAETVIAARRRLFAAVTPIKPVTGTS